VLLTVGVERLLGRQTITKVRLRRRVLSTATRTQELRNGDRDQNGNDQHDHHQLDEGEAFLAVPTPGNEGTNGLHCAGPFPEIRDGKITRLHSTHLKTYYAVFGLNDEQYVGRFAR